MSLIKTYKTQQVFTPSKLAYDYTGAKYGKLTIMHALGIEGVHTMWRARCECGTEVKVRSHQLSNGIGKIDSCGKCQHLPRYNLPELPYTLTEYGDKPEQGELDLTVDVDMAEIEARVAEAALDNIFKTEPAKHNEVEAVPITACGVAEHEKPYEVTAWDVAGECCGLLNRLEHTDQIKALQLIKVELGYSI